MGDRQIEERSLHRQDQQAQQAEARTFQMYTRQRCPQMPLLLLVTVRGPEVRLIGRCLLRRIEAIKYGIAKAAKAKRICRLVKKEKAKEKIRQTVKREKAKEKIRERTREKTRDKTSGKTRTREKTTEKAREKTRTTAKTRTTEKTREKTRTTAKT